MELYAEQIIIEVGRKCNLKCLHCLRGEAEDKTIDLSVAKDFLKEFNFITNICFTGGEPTLYESEIIEIIDFIIEENIGLESFYIATNGLRKSPQLLLKLAELNAYCTKFSDENYSQFELSNDDFHDKVPEDNKNFFKSFSFYSERDYRKEWDHWIPEGRAYENGYHGLAPVNLERKFEWYEAGKDSIGIEMMYLNAEGCLLPDCNYSYNSQREMNPFKYGEKSIYEIITKFNEKELIK